MAVAPDTCIVIELGTCVRRAGASHMCDDGCKTVSTPLYMSHSKLILEGGVYEIWTRKSNYPPHMAYNVVPGSDGVGSVQK